MRNSYESLLCIIIIIALVTMAIQTCTTWLGTKEKKNLFTLRNRSERTNGRTYKKIQKHRKKAKQTSGKSGGSANTVNVEF